MFDREDGEAMNREAENNSDEKPQQKKNKTADRGKGLSLDANVLGDKFLSNLLSLPGSCLEIQRLTLVGGREDYIKASSNTKYVLNCAHRSGYDDPVVNVEWFLHGARVYEWLASKNDVTVSGVLLGCVDSRPREDPHNLHFTKLEYYLAGNYTCKVSSATRTEQKTFYLHVVGE
ncbi:hypothetical protein SK128_027927 [Halocaridina rubra]|uniref:Ig-like domain-containing protein n=1 Tax=Halocaridina rubra TaxID=373956 RepID=A0AAN8XBQ4_HALRR